MLGEARDRVLTRAGTAMAKREWSRDRGGCALESVVVVELPGVKPARSDTKSSGAVTKEWAVTGQ
jgi:hypothetical protein